MTSGCPRSSCLSEIPLGDLKSISHETCPHRSHDCTPHPGPFPVFPFHGWCSVIH